MDNECYVESCRCVLEKIVCNQDFLNDKSPQVLGLPKDKQIDYHTFRYAYFLE